MKFEGPVFIDILEFFKEGKFDFLKLGKSKEWVFNNFPSPDGCNDFFKLRTIDIWNYGNIELHFYNDKLGLIYSDYIADLNGGSTLILNKWFLEEQEFISLLQVIKYLNNEGINFSKMDREDDPRSIDLMLFNSGVKLLFTANDDEKSRDLDQNKFVLVAFSKEND